MVGEDRPRGFLTPDDRNYIRNDREYGTRQQHSNKRRTIRERIRNGILDFPVVHRFDWGQRQRIYDDVEYGSDLYRGLVAAIAFAYQAAETGAGSVDFEELVEEGVEMGIRTLGTSVTTTEEESIEAGDWEDARRENGEVRVDPAEISDEVLRTVRDLPPMVKGDSEEVAIRVVDDVDVAVDVEYRDVPNPIELRRRFLEGEELSHDELGFLLQGKLLADEEAWEQVEERFKRGDS